MDGCFIVFLTLIYICIAVFDIRFRIIPNKMLILLLGAKSLWLVIKIAFLKSTVFPVISAITGLLLMGAACGLAALLLKGNAFVGAGDYKYLVVLGYCLGIEGIPVFCIASLGALLVHLLFMRLLKKPLAKKRIAAAPYFSAGAVIVMLIG